MSQIWQPNFTSLGQAREGRVSARAHSLEPGRLIDEILELPFREHILCPASRRVFRPASVKLRFSRPHAHSILLWSAERPTQTQWEEITFGSAFSRSDGTSIGGEVCFHK